MRKLKRLRLAIAYAALLFASIPATAEGCADFVLKSLDGSYIVGRSLEFGMVLPGYVEIHPRGEKVQSSVASEYSGKTWTSKNAYAGVISLTEGNVLSGFNEKGLSFNALWFPDGIYPQNPKTGTGDVLDFIDMGRWILGTLDSVDDVKKQLPQQILYTHSLKQLGQIPPIHLALHDTTGKSIVVEFINGEMRLFDNPIGVMTNSPDFAWHMTNLRNYINLTAIDSPPEALDREHLLPNGHGCGLAGIPGDWTPPSRFVRLALFRNFLSPPKTGEDGVNAAIHLLNTVDIPLGLVRGNTKNMEMDFTQWISVSDLKNQKMYLRTYRDQNIQIINLSEEKIQEGNPVKKIAMNRFPS